MHNYCTIDHRESAIYLANERKTKWVTLITLFTMVVEIVVGYWSGSMALLADGWHMASHTLALFLSLIVYYLYRHPRFKAAFTFGGGKILSLGGYTSALFLIFIAGSMIYESIVHFFEVKEIHYNEALVVAVIGLIVNLICAGILHDGHGHSHGHDHGHGHGHSHETKKEEIKFVPAQTHEHGSNCSHDHGHHHHHKDHNRDSAYIHILTDALTSVFAIFALLMGKWQGWNWLDPVVGLVGGIVVFKWSLSLIKQSGMDLLDAHDPSIDRDSLIEKLQEDGSKVLDIHLWKLAPGQIGCEIVIQRNNEQHSGDYRDLIQQDFNIQHLVIEVV